MTIPAIPTKYGKRQFRSRLEARWAAFFDLLGWRWEYEPVDLHGWIPDFSLTGKRGTHLVEVKPIFDYDLSVGRKIARAVKGTPWDPEREYVPGEFEQDVVLVGATLPSAKYYGGQDVSGSNSALGWIVGLTFDGHMSGIATFSMGNGLAPGQKQSFDFFDDTMSYGHRMDGQHDGPHHLSQPKPYVISDMWQLAGNATQWKAERMLPISLSARSSGK